MCATLTRLTGTWKPEALRHIGEIFEDGKIVTKQTDASTEATAKAAELAGLPKPATK